MPTKLRFSVINVTVIQTNIYQFTNSVDDHLDFAAHKTSSINKWHTTVFKGKYHLIITKISPLNYMLLFSCQVFGLVGFQVSANWP